MTSPAKQPTLSVVMPCYNERNTIHVSIERVLECGIDPLEVIVVDDGSKDDSLTVLKELEKDGVRAVVHAKNQGFGAACLTGVQAATHPVVVLLNSDVRVEPGFLRPLVRPFADPSVFSVSPLILDREGRPGKVTVNLPRVRRGELVWDGVDPDDLLALSRLDESVPLEVPSLFGLGGAVAVDRARFLALGGFDPLYRPFYHEDVDLGLMAWRRGWRVLVEPRSRVTHEDGGTINRHFAPLRVKVARKRHRLLSGWKHAEGAWRSAQTRGLVLRALTRWLKLDVRFYLALWGALKRRKDALAAHAREEAAAVTPLLEVFPRIVAAWPPAALASAKRAP